MATVTLDQYLASILQSNPTDKNEIRLRAGNADFDLFTIYLENHNKGIHRYRMDVPTILYVAKGNVTIKSGEKIVAMKSGNVLLLTEECKYEIMQQNPDAVLAKLKFKPSFRYRKYFNDFSSKGDREDEVINQIVDNLENEHVLWLKNNLLTRASQVMQHIIGGYLNNDLFAKALIRAELNVMLIISIRTQRMATPTSLDKTKFERSALDNYIDLHFADISLNKTARYFGFNANYFSNMVKSKTGKSFVDHVDERRMREARILLAQPDISLKDIIGRVGYSSKSFFYKKFNQYYQMTPAAMRAELFKQANINLK
ncbi:hypothetical protein B8W86_08580 [Lactobacillus kefiranofaciens]|uniref:helix-turn-helix domain-containing protein n=1 Tax=Lactobacillus kefiranofaciens TaxID=267818 RepID=UPI000BA56A23|nr:AraC family transcriptional regulator [Lactobacillus kefiranofaciens]MCP9331107.1 helix-turn-helix transcriptional regulator [Lactobacillus kefiranofaciens]PAK97722.1 hypothetical protein B8W86_08580 [Lactobacillus kefiranofaciens]